MVSKQCLSKRFLSAGIVALSVLFVALVLCMASPAQAGVRSEGEEEIFFDDMEAGSGTWSVDPATGGWELGSPSGRPGEAHSGDNCWGTVLDGDYPAQRGESMVLSCEIDLGGFEGPTFSFWHWLEIESNHADAAYVEIRAEGEELWTLLWRNPGEDSRGGSYSTDGWEELTLSLESFVDSSIQLRFRLQSDGENNYRGWYVDDVEVQGEPLMKKDAATLGFLSPSAPESFVYKDEVKEIRVQVQNLGLEETVVPVRCLILDMDGEILRNRAEDSEILAPGEMASVLFQWRVPEELGQYYFRAYTELEGDEDPENDIQEVFEWVKGN